MMGNEALQAAGKFEQTTIAFETMLGSASETTALLNSLTEFAAKTPFEMPEIEQAARGLVQFGERGEELMDTLKILGNAASGTSSQFGMVALIFNQIRGVGKLLTQDFRQLSTRGILSLEDLAKHYKTNIAGAQQMLSEGKITFSDVRDIFKELSSEGGRFFNLMEKQSKSYLGLMSTLKDAWRILGREMAESILPVAKLIVEQFIKLVEWFSSLSSVDKTLIGTIVGLVTVLGAVFTMAAGGIAIVSKLWVAYTALTGSTLAASAANVYYSTTANSASLASLGLASSVAKLSKAQAVARALGVAGAVAGAAYVGYKAGSLVPTNERKEIEAEQVTVDQARTINEELDKINNEHLQSVMENAAKLSGVDRTTYLKKEYDALLLNQKGMEKTLTNARDRAKELAPSVLSLWQAGKFVYRGQVEEVQSLEGKLKASKDTLATLRKELGPLADSKAAMSKGEVEATSYIESLTEKRDKLKAVNDESVLSKLITDGMLESQRVLVESLQEEVAVLEASAKAAKAKADAIEKLSSDSKSFIDSLQESIDALKVETELIEAGADASTIADEVKLEGLNKRGANLADLMDMADKMEEKRNLEVVKDTAKLTEELAKQVATFGMTSDEVKLYELSLRGAGAAQLDSAKKLMDQATGMKLLKDMTEKYMTPQEKFNKGLNDLQPLLSQGVKGQQLYQRALVDLNKELVEAQSRAFVEVQFGVGDFEAVRKGTKEFNQLLADVAMRNITAGMPVPGIPGAPPVIAPAIGGPAGIGAPIADAPRIAGIGGGKPPTDDLFKQLLERIAIAVEAQSRVPPITISPLGVS
jgi:tape measure domain-containing protein